MTETILIIPDTHYPYHDKRVFKTLLRIIKDQQPDEIIHIGDLMDYPQPSRWTKGTREEFEGNVWDDSDNCVKDILEPLRAVYDGPIRIHKGNHDIRTEAYMTKYAPALAKTDVFNMENLLRFNDLGITLLPDFYDLAPGWVTTHGHLGGIRLNQNAGSTALGGVKKIGRSIIMGHTHRAGITHYTTGLAGSATTVTGVEVGHIIDTRRITYLKGGSGNWQQAIATVTLDGKHVTPHLHPVAGGKISINKEVYKLNG